MSTRNLGFPAVFALFLRLVIVGVFVGGSFLPFFRTRAAEPDAAAIVATQAVAAPIVAQPVLYLYKDDVRARNEIKALLDLNGYAVTSWPLTGTVLSAEEIDDFEMVLIGDDAHFSSVSTVEWIFGIDWVQNIVRAGRPVFTFGYGMVIFDQMNYNAPTSLAQGYAPITDLVQSIIPAQRGQDAWNEPVAVPLQQDGTALLFNRAVPTVISLTAPSTVVAPGMSLSDRYGYGYAILSDEWATGVGSVCRTSWGFRAPPSAMTNAGRRLLLNLLAGQPCQPFAIEQVDVSVGVVASRESITVGLPLTVTLLVTNTSNRAVAEDVRLRNTLPANAPIAGVRSSQGRCTRANTDLACRIGRLAAGETASVTVSMRPEIGGVSLRNVAEVWSAAEDDDVRNNVFTKSVSTLGTIALGDLVAHPVITKFSQLPNLMQPDYRIHGIEVTSGIQCFDTSRGLAGCPDNSLPVILQKDTMVRIYLDYESLSDPLGVSKVPSVPVALDIYADGVTTTLLVQGTASGTIDRGVHDAAEVMVRFTGNTDKQVRFTARVDPNNVLPETNEANNVAAQTITFQRQRQNLDIAGVRWRRTFGGATYTPQGWAVTGGAANWLNALLPIRNNGVRYTLLPTFKTYTQSMSAGDAQHAAIMAMNVDWILANSLGGLFGNSALDDKDLYYGWFSNTLYSGGHADMPIYPHAGGLGIVGIGTDRVSDGNRTVDNPGGGPLIFGHELVHDFDVMHTNTADGCGSSDAGTTFPYGSSSIQEFGFNPTTRQIYDPATTHDLMSYCPAGGSTQGWISPFTWVSMTALLDQGTAARFSPVAGALTGASSLVVNLRVTNPYTTPEDQIATFTAVALVEDESAPVLPQPGPYVLDLRAEDGAVVASHSFSLTFHSEYAGHAGEEIFPSDETTDAGASMRVPWVDGAVKLVVHDGVRQLGEQTLSASAPMVKIVEPSAPITPSVGSLIALAWNGQDEDEDALTYSVFYSPNGVDWSMLAQGVPSTTIDIPVDELPGGSDAAFAVVASDGFRVSSAQTPFSIIVPGKAPEALITSSPSEVTQTVGTLVQLNGAGFDYEDGTLPEVLLEWVGSRKGALGSGASMAVPDLEVGRHVFTLTVTDSDGETGSAAVTVNVVEPTAEATPAGAQIYVPFLRR